MAKRPTERVATVTWIASHTLFSDGRSSAASVYQTVMASPRVSSTGAMTNSPSQRRSRLVDQTQNASTVNMAPTTANSNMLPSGQRCTDAPRSTADRTRRKPPSQVSVPAMPAALRARSGTAPSSAAPASAGAAPAAGVSRRGGSAGNACCHEGIVLAGPAAREAAPRSRCGTSPAR